MVCWSQEGWQVDSVGAEQRGRGQAGDVDNSLLHVSDE